jgi:hypothetical protein
MLQKNLNLATTLLLTVFAAVAISCSSPGGSIISKFNKKIGTEAVKKELKKTDIIYSWNNVSVEKDAELNAIVEDFMKVTPSQTQPLSPYYNAQEQVVPGKFLKYWVYETAKLGVELNCVITGKTMTVEVRITKKIGAQ